MNHIQNALLLLSLLLLPIMAEVVMKVTLSSSVSEEKMSILSTIVFDQDGMVTGARYNLNEIQKIEFYDDLATFLGNTSQPHSTTSAISQGQIGFVVTGSQLKLSLPQTSTLTVSFYSLTGRKVAELFSGTANEGELNLNFSNANLATGVYSVMVRTENSLVVRKLMID